MPDHLYGSDQAYISCVVDRLLTNNINVFTVKKYEKLEDILFLKYSDNISFTSCSYIFCIV